MRMTTDGMLEELTALARTAGDRIMRIYTAAATAHVDKADGSPLTAADLVSHQTIVEGLRALSPDCPILSEESAAEDIKVRQRWHRFWLVDPLDGTKEFIKRNGEFTVNIALIEDGVPVLGVVHAPALGQTYFARSGGGAYHQRAGEAPHRMCVAVRAGQERLRIVGSRSHADVRQEALIEHLGGGDFLSMGSSLKLCLVAEGRAHLYPRLGPTMEWDTAAAQCIVHEAGGLVCDAAGEALRYNKADLHNPPFAVLAAADAGLRERLRMWTW